MNTPLFIAAIIVSFLGMELVSYLAHRYIYHGIGWRFHKSHHTKRKGVFEKNDVFPAFFATTTMTLMMLSLQLPSLAWLLPFSIGISAYGVLYFIVHDLYVHRRSKRFRPRLQFLIPVKKAHAIHHRYGGEPYGLLFYFRDDVYRRERDVTEDEVV